MKEHSYQKFLMMLALSFIIMYAVMFLNVDKASHIYISATRFYMALLMIAPMALLMLLMMRSMYKHKTMNRIIVISSLVVFVGALAMLRSQTFISDEQYMKAMIPHHSSAILTSKHAQLKDPEVKELAAGIIRSQEREIAQMKAILKRMEE